MKKLVLGVFMWLTIVSAIVAQRSELGGFAGGSFYLGDLNPSKLFSQTQPTFGAVYRYNLTTRWALRSNVFSGMVKGDDVQYNNDRNLSFRSRINEFSIQAEVNYLPYFTGSRKQYRFSPYLFGGIALFSFNPQAYYYNPANKTGVWRDLAKMSTEGQNLPEYPEMQYYRTTQISLPFGLGFKYSLNATFSIGLEWGLRKTFTDYIDDVSGVYADPEIIARQLGEAAAYLSDPSGKPTQVGSARGSANRTDWYSFAGVTITAKVGKARKEPCDALKKSAMDRIKRTMFSD